MKVKMDASENIRLDFADMKFPPPLELVRLISKEAEKVNLYPSGDYSELKEQFAKYVGLNKENILCGNGLDEIIDLITRIFGDVVLIPIPTFSQFELAAKRRNAQKILKNCLKDDKYELAFSDEDLKKASLVWICNPNNPTGTKIEREKIIEILNKAEGIVVVDECFSEFLNETIVDLVNKYKNLIVIRSLSKTFGIAGLRLGFMSSNKENIEKVEKIRQIFNVNRIAEEVGKSLFKFKEYYSECWKKLSEIRDEFISKCKGLGIYVFDSYTNFVLLKFKNKTVMNEVYENLLDNNVVVFPAGHEEFTGLNGPFIRITIGTKEDMDRVYEIISKSI